VSSELSRAKITNRPEIVYRKSDQVPVHETKKERERNFSRKNPALSIAGIRAHGGRQSEASLAEFLAVDPLRVGFGRRRECSSRYHVITLILALQFRTSFDPFPSLGYCRFSMTLACDCSNVVPSDLKQWTDSADSDSGSPVYMYLAIDPDPRNHWRTP